MPLKRARFKISDYNQHRQSDQSKRARRIRMVSLSLTSMVDMFAILVIFLLANSATVSQWIEVGHGIELPKAKFSDPPPRALSLQVSPGGVYGDRDRLATLEELSQGQVAGIRRWLQANATREKNVSSKDAPNYVNVVADHRLPFGVVRRVVNACQEAGYKSVNLAVQPRT